jgi:hypothetical protein
MSSLSNFLIGGVVLATVGHYIGSLGGAAMIEPPKQADTRPASPIDQGATDPYTRADYPDVVRQFGKLIPTINTERRKVAEIASHDSRCDGVENVQITDKSSKDHRRYMAECANSTRFYFDQTSFTNGVAVGIQTWDDILRDGLRDW